MEKNEERTDSSVDVRRRERKLIYRILIVLALGVGFGKIISVDSAYDRAIQNYRMQQLPNVLEKKSKELAEKGTARFVLAHLSKENNHPDIARQATLASLIAGGFAEGKDFRLAVSPPVNDTHPIIL